MYNLSVMLLFTVHSYRYRYRYTKREDKTRRLGARSKKQEARTKKQEASSLANVKEKYGTMQWNKMQGMQCSAVCYRTQKILCGTLKEHKYVVS